MFAAIDDVHHRHRQNAGRGAADITIERLAGEFRRRLGCGQRYAQNGIGPQTTLVVGAVQLDHRLVNGDLFGGVDANQGLGDFTVHGRHGL